MKREKIIRDFFGSALFVFVIGCSQQPTQSITIKNPYPFPLNNSCLVVERKMFNQNDNSLHPVIWDVNKKGVLPCQTDDLDDDGIWDELVILISLKVDETFFGKIQWVKQKDTPKFQTHTNVYLGISRNRDGHFIEVQEEIFPPMYECKTPYQYQFEGVGWENDVIAFRTYCDRRNGKDIFGKTTQEMILSNIGKIENYHERQSWGMDILKVGNSLGIGAVGAIHDGVLYRLGDTQYHDFKCITEGPIRSIFKLGFDGWTVGSDTLSATETITIIAGKNGFINQVVVTGKNVPDTLISGLSMIGINGEREWMKVEEFHGIILSGINDVDDHFLGMAIFTDHSEGFSARISPLESEIYDINRQDYKATKFHPFIADTYYLTTTGPAATFYVFAMWGNRYPEIITSNMFKDKITNEIRSLCLTPEVIL